MLAKAFGSGECRHPISKNKVQGVEPRRSIGFEVATHANDGVCCIRNVTQELADPAARADENRNAGGDSLETNKAKPLAARRKEEHGRAGEIAFERSWTSE